MRLRCASRNLQLCTTLTGLTCQSSRHSQQSQWRTMRSPLQPRFQHSGRPPPSKKSGLRDATHPSLRPSRKRPPFGGNEAPKRLPVRTKADEDFDEGLDYEIGQILRPFVRFIAWPSLRWWRVALSALLLGCTCYMCSFSPERVPYSGRIRRWAVDLDKITWLKKSKLKSAIGVEDPALVLGGNPINIRLQNLLDQLTAAAGLGP